MSFIIKYKPKTLEEYINQEKAVASLKDYVFNYKNKYQGKAILFWGPPGVGKTTLVHAFANTYNLELIEINASDDRNAKKLKELFDHASKMVSLFKKGKIFLFDEIDGISPIDKGAINTIANIIKKSKYPIVLIANDPWGSNLKEIRNLSIIVEFKKLTTTHIYKVLKNICEKEGIKYEDLALKQLALQSSGDLRAAINDLQSLAKIGVTMETIKELGFREREINVFETLALIFKTEKASVALRAISEAQVDLDILMNWIEENIPVEYEDLEEVWKGYLALSKADIFKTRIIRRQSWSLLPYVSLLISAGVALAKKKKYRKFTKYKRPSIYLKLAQVKYKKSLIEKIISSINKTIKVKKKELEEFVIPLITKLYKKNKEVALKLANIYGLSEEEVKVLI